MNQSYRSDRHLYYYRHVIHSNNHGIEHMKQKEYREAKRCFQQAIRHVKKAIEPITIVQDNNVDGLPTVTDYGSANHTSIHPTYFSLHCKNHHDDDDFFVDVMSSDTMILHTSTTKKALADDPAQPNDVTIHAFRPIRIDLPTVDIASRETLLNDDYSIEMDRALSILFYNIVICDLYAQLNVRCHRTKLPFKLSMKLLMLAHELTQKMTDRLENHHGVNANTAQTWYGIHQIELLLLRALQYMMHHHSVVPCSHGNTIEERIRYVQGILHAQYGFIHVLAYSTTTAPCA